LQIIEHGPKIFEVWIAGYTGFFASAESAEAWALQRISGDPYDAIPAG
jgi:hypothetical protein